MKNISQWTAALAGLALMALLTGCSGSSSTDGGAAPAQQTPVKIASAPAKGAKPGSSPATGPFTCPVTGNKVPTVAASAGKSTFKGKTYYFCCELCKPKFDKTPQKYVDNAAKGKFEPM